MTGQLVDRLRADGSDLCSEAADEIDRLVVFADRLNSLVMALWADRQREVSRES
jgi:hypothetical protein